MIHRLLPFLLMLLVIQIHGFSQETFFVTGRVVDSKTHESLAFVNIIINSNSSKGGTTDIDGKFSLQSAIPLSLIHI